MGMWNRVNRLRSIHGRSFVRLRRPSRKHHMQLRRQLGRGLVLIAIRVELIDTEGRDLLTYPGIAHAIWHTLFRMKSVGARGAWYPARHYGGWQLMSTLNVSALRSTGSASARLELRSSPKR
jgi:hypothetical protein